MAKEIDLRITLDVDADSVDAFITRLWDLEEGIESIVELRNDGFGNLVPAEETRRH